jgi:hypothetical protein
MVLAILTKHLLGIIGRGQRHPDLRVIPAIRRAIMKSRKVKIRRIRWITSAQCFSNELWIISLNLARNCITRPC